MLIINLLAEEVLFCGNQCCIALRGHLEDSWFNIPKLLSSLALLHVQYHLPVHLDYVLVFKIQSKRIFVLAST